MMFYQNKCLKNTGLLLIYGSLLGLFTSCLFQEQAYVPLSADFIPSRTTIQVGDTVKFTNGSQVAASFLWDFKDGTQSTQANPQHVFGDTGRYAVTMVSTKRDKTTSDSMVKEVVVLPAPGQAQNTVLIEGNSEDKYGFRMTQLADGNLVLAGRQNLGNLQVIKTPDGATRVWETDLNNIARGQLFVEAVKELSDGSIVVVGHYFDLVGASDAFIVKLDADGKEAWRNKLATVDHEIYKDFVEGSQASVVVLASINQTQVQLNEYSSAGVLIRSKTFGETHVPASMLWDQNAKIIIAGTNLSSSNPFVLQLDSELTQEKLQDLGFDGEIFKIIQLTNGDLVVAGNQTIDSSRRAMIARVNVGSLATVWLTNPMAYSRKASEETFVDVVASGQNVFALGTHGNPLSGTDVLVCKYGQTNEAISLEMLSVFGGSQDEQGRQLLLSESTLFFIGETESFSNSFKAIYFVKLDLNLD
ncbi:PKD domain-containing protein [Microscilla marina]|nr:PKD domain-containing protein [Microscilla marina]